MIRINVLYDPERDVLSVSLPYVEIEADRKSKMLTYREIAEGTEKVSKRAINNVAFSDVVNLIANNVKEYIR